MQGESHALGVIVDKGNDFGVDRLFLVHGAATEPHSPAGFVDLDAVAVFGALEYAGECVRYIQLLFELFENGNLHQGFVGHRLKMVGVLGLYGFEKLGCHSK